MEPIIVDLEHKKKLEIQYDELVCQIAEKNIRGENYSDLLEKVRTINEQLLILDIEISYEKMLKKDEKNNMR